MHHLTLEDLARLVDEVPTAEERAHLDFCERCASELDAITLQTGMLGGLADPILPQPLHLKIRESLVAGAPEPVVANHQWWIRAAAGFVLFIIGTAAGTFGIAPRMAPGAATPAIVEGPPAPDPAASLAQAEEAYLRALTDFARHNYGDGGLDPISRLAALEGIVLTTQSALRAAPADPVINNYYLTALGQRDALLRQLEEVSDTLEWF